jgi:hypothetical protein
LRHAPPPTDDHGQAAQLRIAQQLHAGEKSIHVQVGDAPGRGLVVECELWSLIALVKGRHKGLGHGNVRKRLCPPVKKLSHTEEIIAAPDNDGGRNP